MKTRRDVVRDVVKKYTDEQSHMVEVLTNGKPGNIHIEVGLESACRRRNDVLGNITSLMGKCYISWTDRVCEVREFEDQKVPSYSIRLLKPLVDVVMGEYQDTIVFLVPRGRPSDEAVIALCYHRLDLTTLKPLHNFDRASDVIGIGWTLLSLIKEALDGLEDEE